MIVKRLLRWLLFVSGINLLFVSLSFAVTIDDTFTISGFMTAGAAKVNNKDAVFAPDNELAAFYEIGHDLGFTSDSKIALQITSRISDKFSATTQFMGRKKKTVALDLAAEWAFITYHGFENSIIRTGRMRAPLFQFSDFQDVGYSYLWVRPPLDVLSLTPSSIFDGVDMIYSNSIGDSDYSYTFQPFIGTAPGTTDIVGVNDMMGFNISLEHEIFTLRFMALNSTINTQSLSPERISVLEGLQEAYSSMGYNDIAKGFDVEGQSGELYSLSFNVNWKDNVFLGEYAHRKTGDLYIPVTDAYFVTLARRIGKFTPHFTFARTKADHTFADKVAAVPDAYYTLLDSQSAGTGALIKKYGNYLPGAYIREQRTMILGVKYEPQVGYDIKLEFQRIIPENGSKGQFLEGDGVNDLTNIDYDGSPVNMVSICFDIVF
ncbi:MAG: hypothetical protein D6B27_08960 [Gammaproteobacteria bacterium]|nr:MAG: hypothetical protein D6B27_08960 [Gammaproteobacteria bacterium]